MRYIVLDTRGKVYTHGHELFGYCRLCRRSFRVLMSDHGARLLPFFGPKCLVLDPLGQPIVLLGNYLAWLRPWLVCVVSDSIAADRPFIIIVFHGGPAVG